MCHAVTVQMKLAAQALFRTSSTSIQAPDLHWTWLREYCHLPLPTANPRKSTTKLISPAWGTNMVIVPYSWLKHGVFPVSFPSPLDWSRNVGADLGQSWWVLPCTQQDTGRSARCEGACSHPHMLCRPLLSHTPMGSLLRQNHQPLSLVL